jgi:hypothetical protein
MSLFSVWNITGKIEESRVCFYLTADKPEEQLLQCREVF